MRYTLSGPQELRFTVPLPASKSVSNRALVINALARGPQLPLNLSDCDDTRVVLDALRHMPEIIDIGAGGTAMRFMTAYLCTLPGHVHTITGTERMKHRPIGKLVDALRQLGAQIDYLGEEGFPPLRIQGSHLAGGSVVMDGGVSSQFISALLMIGPVMEHGLELTLTGQIISRPYIDLTLHTMHDFGAKVDWTDINVIAAEPTGYRQRPYYIENDWSASSYWYEMMALSQGADDEVVLQGLTDASRQGDSVARYLFSMLGIRSRFGSTEQGVPTTVTLKRFPTRLPRFDYDFVNQPDLAQTLVVTCAMLDVPFHFTGLATLRIKETDRLEALVREMRKLGFVVEERNGSELMWDGTRCQPTGEPIDTYEDHRMALAFAPACLRLGSLTINNPGVVTKSYPMFWNHLRQAGFTITEEADFAG